MARPRRGTRQTNLTTPLLFKAIAVGPASTLTANPTAVASAGGASIGAPLNTVFRHLYLLLCEYFCDVRMNGGGFDRAAWTMQGARTPFQESNNRIVRAAAPIAPSPCPFAQPMFPQRVPCVFRVVRALRVHFCFCLWRSCYPFCVCCAFCAFRSCCLCCCLWSWYWCSVFYRVSFLNNLIL